MRLLWLDPFHGGSHAAVTRGYAAHSRAELTLLTLPIDGGWRWRMRGGAVTLARMVRERGTRPDLLVASDMLDLASFRALSADLLAGVPAAVYFHENQLTYPLPTGRQRDLSFAWINYTSALVADAVIFNSTFHRDEFLAALPGLLGRYHDYQELQTIEQIAARSHVLPPGIDLATLDLPSDTAGTTGSVHRPTILWNSRWEYDKQPAVFFAALEGLAARGADFRLIVAGEHIDPNAAEFVAARERWADRIDHWGYVSSRSAYAQLLGQADIVVSTAIQEFFGIGIVEAMYCGCTPILPARLNYPDLIPPALHSQCLYRNTEQLVDLLARALAAPPAIDWRAIAAVYAWERVAPRYDSLFAALAC